MGIINKETLLASTKDGELKNSLMTVLKINKASVSGISIGQSRQANGHWYNFAGKLDDIRIWSRNIGSDEIAFLARN